MRYYSLDVMKTASVDVQLGWATYVRAADEAAAAATPKKEEQLGEWYLRTRLGRRARLTRLLLTPPLPLTECRDDADRELRARPESECG